VSDLYTCRLVSYPLRMEPSDYLSSLVHRRVNFRYSRRGLQFDLSTALFSSAGVDAGTLALLRVLEGPAKELQPACVLDVGCGTGTLGISLAAATGATLNATDRDALAVWFTSRNATLNKIASVNARAALVLQSPFRSQPWQSPDIAVCNLPAKAGEAVLRHMISVLPGHVSERGLAAVVIVTSLEELLMSELKSLPAHVIARRETRGHVAVVYSAAGDSQNRAPALQPDTSPAKTDNLLPAIYTRAKNTFSGPNGTYRLTVAYNLPEFDSLSHTTELVFRLLRNTKPTGRVFLWGVGQGHLAVGGIQSSREATILIADRDLLAVTTTVANLRSSHTRATVQPVVAPGLGVAADQSGHGGADWMIVHSHPEPGSRCAEELAYAAERLLGSGGRLVAVSRSTSLSRLTSVIRRSFTQLDSLRHHGYRADLMIRKR